MAASHFPAESVNYAADYVWHDTFRVIGRRYWVRDLKDTAWMRVTPHEFTEACQWYLLEHTDEDVSAHPTYHYKVAVDLIRSQIIARTRDVGFTPPVSP